MFAGKFWGFGVADFPTLTIGHSQRAALAGSMRDVVVAHHPKVVVQLLVGDCIVSVSFAARK
jgi:hypothetical protein